MIENNQNLEAIKEAFTKTFIEAISSQSIEACAALIISDEDNKIIEVDYGLPQEEYEKRLLIQSQNFLTGKSDFINRKNADKDSAINLDNFLAINTYNFKLEEGYKAAFIKTISISMKERLIDGIIYQVGFQIDDALLINGKIKINNLFNVRMYENYWDDINEENTPYPKVENNEKLKEIFTDHLDKEYIDIIYNWNDWYVHEGDLVLEKYDLKVNFIVTGNLTIKEPLVEIEHELIVLGNTKINSLLLDETNDVLFLGGIEFKHCIIILSTGPYQILHKPKGPLLITNSESHEIGNTDQVQCFINYQYEEFHGNIHDLLSDEFISEDTDISELDIEEIEIAIRNGQNIFKHT